MTLMRSLNDVVLPFERTAGDEIQGLLRSGSPIARLVEGLARLDAHAGLDEPGWRVGIGIGDVENVRVESTRAARGSAYLAAREAVEAASRAPAHVAIRAADGTNARLVSMAEDALVLLRTVLARRSDKGWEVTDAVAAGESQADIAKRLEVSESAISQRLGRALWREGVRGVELAETLLGVADRQPGTATSGGRAQRYRPMQGSSGDEGDG